MVEVGGLCQTDVTWHQAKQTTAAQSLFLLVFAVRLYFSAYALLFMDPNSNLRCVLRVFPNSRTCLEFFPNILNFSQFGSYFVRRVESIVLAPLSYFRCLKVMSPTSVSIYLKLFL